MSGISTNLNTNNEIIIDSTESSSDLSMQPGCSEAKKPCKGILKNTSKFDRQSASYRKNAKFDENNVLQTYHPVDKDYGHIKIDEPKTPFAYVNESNPRHDFDPDLLAEKLRLAANAQTPVFAYEDNSDEEFLETPSERVHRIAFERRRKAHYNECKAAMLARKLIQVELGDEDISDYDDVEASEAMSSSSSKNQDSMGSYTLKSCTNSIKLETEFMNSGSGEEDPGTPAPTPVRMDASSGDQQ